MKRTSIFSFSVFVLLLLALPAEAQQFFNLTTAQVSADEKLPRFHHAFPLTGQYEDSLYTVSILYPEFIDMSPADIARYRQLSSEPLQALPKVEQHVSVTRRQGMLEVDFCPYVFRDGRYQILVSFMLKREAMPLKRSLRKTNAARTSSKASRYASHSVLASGTWAKIRVPSSGIYELTADVARRAGFSDFSKVKVYGYGGALQNEVLSEADLIAYDDLKEVPVCTVGGRRFFYAQGPVSWANNSVVTRTRNPYSNYGYYFITQSDEAPATLDSAAFMATYYPAADDYHTLHEVDDYAWFQGGRNLYESSPVTQGQSKSWTLSGNTSVTAGYVTVVVSAGIASKVNVAINGRQLGTISVTIRDMDHDNGAASTRSFRVDSILTSNEVKITTTDGGPVRLDYIALTMDKPRPAPDLRQGGVPAAEYVYNITNQDHHGDPACDMVIIIPTTQKLLKQANRLADFHRQHDGLRVNVVPSDELINEFSSGTPDASAYRRYMKMLYDRAETDGDLPRYLLLFGDCAWDNRMNTSLWRQKSPDDYLLCYESENSFSELHSIVSDDFFCLMDEGEQLIRGSYPENYLVYSTGTPDIAVGRFPVTTAEDAKVLVDKTIDYATNAHGGSWQNTLVFMGDDGNKDIHMMTANRIAEDVLARYPGYVVRKIMWDAYNRVTTSTGANYPDVTKAIKQYQTNGALMMNYAGHGRADQISHEAVLNLRDFMTFSNTTMPLWITASCDIMPFDGATETIGESALLNSKGGTMAFWGTTRTVYANRNEPIDMAFTRYVLSFGDDGKPVTIGEAQRLAKVQMITSGADDTDNKLQYSLLGDPALALQISRNRVVVDAINGVAPTEERQPQLKAGSVARVEGHIEGDSNFNGVVTALIRDAREIIVCKQNDKTPGEMADTAFAYYDRTKNLYSGSDSVRQGKFDISFAVPMDIKYSDASGQMSLFAISRDKQTCVNGQNENFLIGGTETAGNDSIGPSVYCYLNSPSFVNGGNVNPTPFFVAEITDHDGINASGNGIGHDLQLVIDGKTERTYILNDNFQFDFGSYTSGTTFYSIPELEPGPHRLLFRAWDVLNNSTTTELTFQVLRGLQPALFGVDCTQNPATTSTTFIISNDRTGSTMDVELDIFDMSGRMLWKHQESGVSTDGAYTMDWDLTVDGGARLQTGVYLYRVRVSSDGSDRVSKTRKIVII